MARVAGVSYQTVSRVINNHPSVKPQTRQRVLDAIGELGFRRSAAAVTLAKGRARSVTVVTSNTTLYGYAATLQGVEEAAQSAGFSVGVTVLKSAEEAEVRSTVERAVDTGGALLVIAYDEAGAKALTMVPADVPHAAAVETPGGAVEPGTPWEWLDDRTAARDATRHLLGLGHRTVHYVALPYTRGGTATTPRAAGWREALRQANITPPRPHAVGWDAGVGYRAGLQLAGDLSVTAVLCGNDDLALGVMRALHECGRSVPGDVSVIGFDDAPQSAFLTPSLTTVRLDFAGLGRACFALVRGQVDRSDRAQEDAPYVAPPRLVLRESAGAPPRTG